MSKEIVKYNLPSIPANREELVDKDNIKQLLTNINDLKNVVFDFSTKETIKEAKGLKTSSNKFIKEFKELCDPFEAEGKEIGKTRSEIKLTLERLVNDKLEPIIEREKLLVSIKDKLFIPSSDIESCNLKLDHLRALDGAEWFALKDEALQTIKQSITFLENELVGFKKKEEELKEEERKAREERDAMIAKEATDIAIKETEERIKREQVERLPPALQKINIVSRNEADLLPNNNTEYKRKIHNEILQDIRKLPYNSDDEFIKDIIRAVAENRIGNLRIVY